MCKKWIPFTTVPLLLILTACDLGPSLEVRTFQVDTTDTEQLQSVGVLIQPYVYKDRPNAPGSMSVSTAANAITVRETPDNLDRIERMLAQLDLAQTASVRLIFQLIEANGAGEADPTIADVVEELRKTFRFAGYSLAGDASITVEPGHSFEQVMQTNTGDLTIGGTLETTGHGHTLAVRFVQDRVGEGNPYATRKRQNLLTTSVGISPGQTLVLGSVPLEGAAALLLVARMTKV